MYAPTWRENVEDSGLSQIGLLKIDVLLRTLHNRFGGDWAFLLRCHGLVTAEMRNRGIFEQYPNYILDGNKHSDMMEYMYATDILLTDFSGSVFDVALSDKPCFLFAHDMERYERERGMYKPISFFPYPFSESFEDLLKDIMGYDEKNAEIKRTAFLQTIGNKNDGHSAERAVELIKRKMNTNVGAK